MGLASASRSALAALAGRDADGGVGVAEGLDEDPGGRAVLALVGAGGPGGGDPGEPDGEHALFAIGGVVGAAEDVAVGAVARGEGQIGVPGDEVGAAGAGAPQEGDGGGVVELDEVVQRLEAALGVAVGQRLAQGRLAPPRRRA